MDEIDLELIKAKKRVKDIKQVKKMKRKHDRLMKYHYRCPPLIMFGYWFDSILDTFKNIVNR